MQQLYMYIILFLAYYYNVMTLYTIRTEEKYILTKGSRVI